MFRFIPLKGELEQLKLNPDKLIIAICRSAHRSIPAVRLLREQGYRKTYQLEGGMLAWEKWQEKNQG